MIWQILKHEGFEGGEKIEYYKLPRRFKLLVTHSNAEWKMWRRCVGITGQLT